MTDEIGISNCLVRISHAHLRRMCRFVKQVSVLADLELYQQRVELDGLPEVARHEPGHHSVMMAYDFHITDDGPKLIEVNTNAGGGYLAARSQLGKQSFERDPRYRALVDNVLSTFDAEFAGFSGNIESKPAFALVIDGRLDGEFQDPETHAFANALREHWGCEVKVVEASETALLDGALTVDGRTVDLVYNRCCDFYLRGHDLESLLHAYLDRRLCVTPNPRAYGLLADKRRMILWSSVKALREVGVAERAAKSISTLVPKCALMSSLDRAELWASRRDWVFKPTSLYAGKGVLLGRAIRRRRFEEMDPERTIVQQYIKPSITRCENLISRDMKTEIRLFAYRDQVLGVAARLYQGQLTNFRAPGSGYARVVID